MLFKKEKTELQPQHTREIIFTFFYWENFQIQKDTIHAISENEAIEKFKRSHPDKFNETAPYGYEFSFMYDFIDSNTGKTYTHTWNESYLNHMRWRQQMWLIKSEQLIIDKKPKSEPDPSPDLQPLYYRKNGTYYETGLYIDPSKLHNLIPALPEETD